MPPQRIRQYLNHTVNKVTLKPHYLILIMSYTELIVLS